MKKMVLIPYERYMQSTKPESDEKTISSESISPSSLRQNKRLDEELILMEFGKHHHKQAKTLLAYVEKQSELDWNEFGELLVDGETINGSHITDLIKDALFNYKNFEPKGYEIFYSHLSSIPYSLIRNPKRREQLGKGRSRLHQGAQSYKDPYSPPPGIPMKQNTVEINPSIEEWREAWKTL